MAHQLLIRQLESWYAAHCNDEWEHEYGVRITMNSDAAVVWSIEIDIPVHELGMTEYDALASDRKSWTHSALKFIATTGPRGLVLALHQFLDHFPSEKLATADNESDDYVDQMHALQEYWADFEAQEAMPRPSICIDTIDNPGWSLTAMLPNVPNVAPWAYRYDDDDDEWDWLHTRWEPPSFTAACGPYHLSTAIRKMLGLYNAGNGP